MLVQPCKSVLRYQKKIKILTWLPSSLTRNVNSSLSPDVTVYMIERAKSLEHEKGVYSEPVAYAVHPINETTEKMVILYK